MLRGPAPGGDAHEDQRPPDLGSTLVDLTMVSLQTLRTLDGSVLARSLRRLLDEADNSHDIIAGFDSSI